MNKDRDPKYGVHWYCPYCHTKHGMTNNQWEEYLKHSKHLFDIFPYCNKRCKFLMALKGRYGNW